MITAKRSCCISIAVGLLLSITDCSAQSPTLTRPVIVVVPYVAVLPLDTAESALGRTGCDLNNQPVIYLNRHVPSWFVPWVLYHERRHVEQMRSHPDGCYAFARRYLGEPAFRLKSEADAFCAVYEAELDAGLPPIPALPDIVRLLSDTSAKGYKPQWSVDEVHAAMSCWKAAP